MRPIRALRDCKQRSLTVSKKTSTVSKKASPPKNSLSSVFETVLVENVFGLSAIHGGLANLHSEVGCSLVV